MKADKAQMRFGLLLVIAMLVAVPAAQAGYEEATNYLKAGKYLEAAAEFQALVDENPDYAGGHYMLGVCFLKTSRPADAEKALLKATELEGSNFLYHYNLASSYQMRQQYSKVIGTLNNAEGLAASDDHKFRVLQMRGFALAMKKDWESAIADLERAERIKSDGSSLTQLGKAYLALGDNDNAVTYLRKSLKVKSDAENHRLLSEALLNMAAKTSSDTKKASYYREALSHADSFLKAEPGSSNARYLVGRAALGSKNYDQAISAFTKVLEQKSNNCNAMANLGKAFTAKKEWSNALQAVENATVCDPKMAIAWENKGFVLQKMGTDVARSDSDKTSRYRQAIAAYKKAEAIKPSAAITKAIDTCNHNIDVIESNLAVDAQERKQQEAIDEANREFEEAQRRQEEWKKKQDGD